MEFDVILAAARGGEEWAVAVIYRDLHPRLSRYLRARERGAAEDLESEVWLAVAAGLPRFVGGEIELRAWAFSIARRRLADYRRTATRRATEPVPAEQLDRPGQEDTETLALDGLSAEAAARFVAAALPNDQAEVVLLRVLGDLDVRQVAAMLGKRPETVRVLAHRGLRRLQALLTGEPVTR